MMDLFELPLSGNDSLGLQFEKQSPSGIKADPRELGANQHKHDILWNSNGTAVYYTKMNYKQPASTVKAYIVKGIQLITEETVGKVFVVLVGMRSFDDQDMKAENHKTYFFKCPYDWHFDESRVHLVLQEEQQHLWIVAHHLILQLHMKTAELLCFYCVEDKYQTIKSMRVNYEHACVRWEYECRNPSYDDKKSSYSATNKRYLTKYAYRRINFLHGDTLQATPEDPTIEIDSSHSVEQSWFLYIPKPKSLSFKSLYTYGGDCTLIDHTQTKITENTKENLLVITNLQTNQTVSLPLKFSSPTIETVFTDALLQASELGFVDLNGRNMGSEELDFYWPTDIQSKYLWDICETKNWILLRTFDTAQAVFGNRGFGVTYQRVIRNIYLYSTVKLYHKSMFWEPSSSSRSFDDLLPIHTWEKILTAHINPATEQCILAQYEDNKSDPEYDTLRTFSIDLSALDVHSKSTEHNNVSYIDENVYIYQNSANMSLSDYLINHEVLYFDWKEGVFAFLIQSSRSSYSALGISICLSSNTEWKLALLPIQPSKHNDDEVMTKMMSYGMTINHVEQLNTDWILFSGEKNSCVWQISTRTLYSFPCAITVHNTRLCMNKLHMKTYSLPIPLPSAPVLPASHHIENYDIMEPYELSCIRAMLLPLKSWDADEKLRCIGQYDLETLIRPSPLLYLVIGHYWQRIIQQRTPTGKDAPYSAYERLLNELKTYRTCHPTVQEHVRTNTLILAHIKESEKLQKKLHDEEGNEDKDEDQEEESDDGGSANKQPTKEFFRDLLMKHKEKGIQLLNQCKSWFALKPPPMLLLVNCDELAYLLECYEECIEIVNILMPYRSDLGVSYNNLAHYYNKLSQYDKAYHAAQQAVALNYKYSNAFRHLGIACEGLGNLEAAKDALTQAIQLKADYTAAKEDLNRVMMKLSSKETIKATEI